MSRVFELTDQAHALAEAFIVEHNCSVGYTGAIGGKISYEFTETSIGTIIEVKCGCGEGENLTDYSEW